VRETYAAYIEILRDYIGAPPGKAPVAARAAGTATGGAALAAADAGNQHLLLALLLLAVLALAVLLRRDTGARMAAEQLQSRLQGLLKLGVAQLGP
jgi:hypothetical protein